MPITVKRLSDNNWMQFDFGPKDWVKKVKDECKANFKPAHPNGCRLMFNGKVMKSRHHLKHYKVTDGAEIIMDDRKNWSSSSSSSSSTTD